MLELRTILLLIGVGVILGVYAWTRWQQRPATKPRNSARSRPKHDDPDVDDIEQELARMEQLVSGREPASADREAEDDKLIVLSVVAEPESPFGGEALSKALTHNKLIYGEQGIYHRLVVEHGESHQRRHRFSSCALSSTTSSHWSGGASWCPRIPPWGGCTG